MWQNARNIAKKSWPLLRSDIRFWLLLLFLIRLVGITNPPLEVGHNWRQSLTNMIARNFVEEGPDLLHPTVDTAGAATGIIGAEFPFFNLLIYLLAMFTGYEHWLGRLVNLLVSTVGLYFYFKVLAELLPKRLAAYATVVLGVSIWFAFSRKIMPDTFSVSLVMTGLFFALRYLKTGNVWQLLLFGLLSCLGMLCKIPAMSLLSFLGVMWFVPALDRKRVWLVAFTAVLAFLPVAFWYFVWVPHLVSTYGFQLYFPKSLSEGWFEIRPLWPNFLEKFYFSALHSYLGLAACLAGIWVLAKKYAWQWSFALAVFAAVFGLFILKTGAVFPLHNYYIIPFVPVMTLCCGMALYQLKYRTAVALVVLIGIEAIANQQHDFKVPADKAYKLTLESLLEAHVPTGGKVVINGGQSPQDMYFAHRKGWSVSNVELMRPQFADSLGRLGARYLIIDKNQFANSSHFKTYNKLMENQDYVVYALDAH